MLVTLMHLVQNNDDVARHVNDIGPDKIVIAFGNGNNDRLMLKAARIGVAVCLNEGCAVDPFRGPTGYRCVVAPNG